MTLYHINMNRKPGFITPLLTYYSTGEKYPDGYQINFWPQTNQNKQKLRL